MRPKIAVSYRRADSAAVTGRIYDRLVARYGDESVFLDIADIPVAIDFRTKILDTLQQCDLVIAIIGPKWLGSGDDHSRIQNDDDPVRAEIELAIQRAVPIMPVLVLGATMPRASELPDGLKQLSFVNAATVDMGVDFRPHMERLIQSIDKILEERGKTLPPSSRAQEPSRPLGAALGPLGSLSTWAIVGVLSTPFLAAWASLAPGEPSRSIAVAVAALIQIVTLGVALRYVKSASPRTIRRTLAGAIAALVIATLAYAGSLSAYTFQQPITKERLAKGLMCSQDALTNYGSKCPNLGIDELKAVGFQAERLWTGQSIAFVQIGILTCWSVVFASLALVVACLLARQP